MPTGRFTRAVAGPTAGVVYWREIGAVLCLKAAGLVLLYVLFFAPSHRPPVTEQIVARHLLAPTGSGTTNQVPHHDQ